MKEFTYFFPVSYFTLIQVHILGVFPTPQAVDIGPSVLYLMLVGDARERWNKLELS